VWTLSRHRSKLTFRQSRSQLELLVLERTEALQRLSQRLLRVQDEERRKVARDLHDSTGQTLTALKISVALLQKRLDNGERIREELSGIALLADAALQEIRTTSYLLHPPMLDETGFTCAAQWYIEGFARRSGMKVRLDFAPQVERLPDTIETALFRVLQESLTNVHRHSGASEVEVRFLRQARVVILEVRDYGRGIPEKLLRRLGQSVQDSGVGLAGMCERLNELKGDLEITSADPGTRLRAIVPLSPALRREEALNSCASVPAGATNRAIFQAFGTFSALTHSAWAVLKRAKRVRWYKGRWETAVGVAAVLVIACWIGFRDRHPTSPLRVSGVQGSHAPRQQLSFEPAKQILMNSASESQTARALEPGERKPYRSMPQAVQNRNIRVRYVADDVTIRYFTPIPPPQQVLDRNTRIRYIADDVTVRYFPPEPAVAPPSTPNGTPARSASR
jgi:anti-sigma regulatory factor (Ser/Thr protein kinase)